MYILIYVYVYIYIYIYRGARLRRGLHAPRGPRADDARARGLLYIYIYIYIYIIYIYIYIYYIVSYRIVKYSMRPAGASEVAPEAAPPWSLRGLSSATCLIWPHVFYVCFAVSRVNIIQCATRFVTFEQSMC